MSLSLILFIGVPAVLLALATRRPAPLRAGRPGEDPAGMPRRRR